MHSRGNRKLPLALFAAATALAACAGGSSVVPVSQTSYDGSFTGEELGYASQFGAVPVYAKGGPFDDARNVDALVAVLNQNQAARELKFAAATAATTSAYSVVFAYGQFVPAANYCDRRAEIPVARAAGTPQIVGSFCLPGRARSQSVLAVPGPGMPSRDAINALVTTLFSAPARRGRSFD